MTNCAIEAWRKYARGDALWIAMRQSSYSSLHGRMAWPFRWLGRLIIYPAAGLWFVGHYLIFGTWPHFIHCQTIQGDCDEVVPSAPKSKRFFPPVIFDPVIQQHQDGDHGDLR